MKLLSAACSDRGIKKKINQDSLLVRSAMTKEGEILLRRSVMEWADWKKGKWQAEK